MFLGVERCTNTGGSFNEKKAAYAEYYKVKDEYRELLTYQANLSGLFGIENAKTEPQKERQQEEK